MKKLHIFFKLFCIIFYKLVYVPKYGFLKKNYKRGVGIWSSS